jgi:hypothetical protein
MINSIAIRLNVAPKDGNFSFDISELEAMLPAGTMDNNVEMVYKEVPYINLIFILIFHINFIIVNFLEANENLFYLINLSYLSGKSQFYKQGQDINTQLRNLRINSLLRICCLLHMVKIIQSFIFFLSK